MNETKYRTAEQRLWEATGETPTESFVTLPRIGVRVRVQELGTGEPVLFIHGGPNSGSTWAPLIEHLDGFRCLMVDRPGTGLSDPYEVGPDNLAWYGSVFVGDVLTALGLQQTHVVASSFGGYLALRSAAAEPKYIRRMVQMAAPALAPGSPTPPFMRLISIRPIRRLIGVLPPNERANNSILRQLGHGASLDAGRITPLFGDWYVALQQHTDTMRHDGDMIGRLASYRGIDPANIIPDEVFAAVTNPTLFLWGADDGFGGEGVARGVVGRMPNAELVMIPDSGHLPWLDDPKSIGAASVAFLNRQAVTDPVAGRAEQA